MLSSTLGRRKVGETFPKSAGCTLEEQKEAESVTEGIRSKPKVHSSDILWTKFFFSP